MKDDLIRLLNAQDYDLDIDKLNDARKEYPREIASLKQEIKTTESELANTSDRIQEIEVKRQTIETEIKIEREMLDEKEKRLLQTKNNKEYNAVHNEIELARERIDALETEDLELMAETDELTPRREELEQAHKEISDVNSAKIDDIQKRFDSIESDIEILNDKRERELREVKNTRGAAIYNRLRQGRSGLAVVAVGKEKHNCMGCYKQLPPQKVMEVRRADKIIMCENCGRILVWDTRGEE